MMEYLQLIKELNKEKEDAFAAFQRKLIDTKQTILGVRTPTLRNIAKGYSGDISTLLSFPDTYYEVTFIKLAVVSALLYEQFVLYVEDCVSRMDNWATCDCFKAKCIANHKAEFLPILEGMYTRGGTFAKRYTLVTLLFYYMDEPYLPLIEKYIEQTPTQEYYLHMAVAWLMAEVLVKHYDFGIRLLQKRSVTPQTHNKGIQKAIESYRLTQKQKEYIRSLKIKK